jgi:glycosyltransferase involved in cell wall biosynthesis
MKVVIGIPAYNEEKNIAKIIVKLQNVTNKIIVCNDGSTDSTSEIADKMGAIVINHPKNLGYGAAIRSLFSKASELDADVLVTFDADGQHRIEDINKVIKPIECNNVDIVIGSRFLGDNEKIPAYRKFGINIITKISNITTKKKITDSQSGFRAYNKKALQEIIPSDNGMGVSTEILIKANKKSLRVIEVPITITYEGETSTHNPLSHGISVILSTMKFISIEHPLKFYGIPGLIFLLTGFIFIIWTIQIYAEYGSVITNIALVGIASTIVATMFLMTSIILYSLVNVVREGKNR